MSNKKRIALNLVATLTAFGIQACIGFFLSPYIVKTIGVEAQGFVQLASNFASYIAIATVAINSMSGRFITIEVHRKNIVKASQYYTSVFWGNLALFTALLIPLALVIVFLERIINIPPNLLLDVKFLFSFVFINLFITNVFSLWNNTFYIVDRLYLQSIGTIIASFSNAIIIVILFSIFPARVWFSTVASLFTAVFTVSYALYIKHKFLPELSVKRSSFSLKSLLEIMSSGIWRTLQSTGEQLLTGLDLLICNLLVGAETMGVLALSKMMPSLIQGINWQMAYTFAPQLTIMYAKEDKEGIRREMKRACKINAIIGTIPIAGLIVFGKEFFSLWQPTQDAEFLQILSILGCFWLAITAGIQPIGNVFVAVNKLKPQAFSVIISGVLNTVIVIACLKFTNLGVLAIAGTSTVIGLARNILYTVPASAKYLGFKWYELFYGFLYSIIGFFVVTTFGIVLKYMFRPHSWIILISTCVFTAVLGLMFNTLLIFNQSERKQLMNTLSAKIPSLRRF